MVKKSNCFRRIELQDVIIDYTRKSHHLLKNKSEYFEYLVLTYRFSDGETRKQRKLLTIEEIIGILFSLSGCESLIELRQHRLNNTENPFYLYCYLDKNGDIEAIRDTSGKWYHLRLHAYRTASECKATKSITQ